MGMCVSLVGASEIFREIDDFFMLGIVVTTLVDSARDDFWRILWCLDYSKASILGAKDR